MSKQALALLIGLTGLASSCKKLGPTTPNETQKVAVGESMGAMEANPSPPESSPEVASNQEAPATPTEPAPAPVPPAAPAPTPSAQEQKPNPAPTNAGPTPTHKFAVTCNNEVKIDATFNGQTLSMNFGQGPRVNGSATLLTVSCPKLMTALNGKSFLQATTASKAQGGPKVAASCNAGVLTVQAKEGDPNGSFASTSRNMDLEALEVCLQVRNVINGLNL